MPLTKEQITDLKAAGFLPIEDIKRALVRDISMANLRVDDPSLPAQIVDRECDLSKVDGCVKASIAHPRSNQESTHQDHAPRKSQEKE